ncbi:MAG: hypothetical protein LBS43_09620 [Prevotellaceae bacterium]|jgi:hypothetical protein|nr:hypothetical protein [Prevotellaceae bacterium]
MKKIGLALFIVSLLFTSCDEKYKEEKGQAFEGTWALVESYVDGAKISRKASFFTAREFEGENLLLFYSGGRYDSSFFYRVQDNNLFVRRVKDLVDVIEYYMLDSNGDTITYEGDDGKKYPKIYRTTKDEWDSQWKFDASGKIIIDTIVEVQKPIYPQTGLVEEKYYGTYSFNEGAQMTLTINRYSYNRETSTPVITDLPPRREIYLRPEEKE